MKNIAVLFGGCSSEYAVSLKSAYGVLTNIDSELYNTIPIGITQDGQWFRYSGDYQNIMEDKWSSDGDNCHKVFLLPDRKVHGIQETIENRISFTPLDALFPVLHGKNGEDGTVQGLAELAGIPVIGCGTLSSALCMDKYRAHVVAASAGIKTPKGVLINRPLPVNELLNKVADLKYPLFVKPLRAGSSLGINKVNEACRLPAAVSEAFAFDSEIIIEETVYGFEVGCAVIGNSSLTVGTVDEIQIHDEFFDYIEKYTQKHSRIFLPARIPESLQQEIQEEAKRIYTALGCSGFARVDMFLTSDKKIVFNEVNTIPGMTAHSRFPKMMEYSGMDFKSLVNRLITDALAV